MALLFQLRQSLSQFAHAWSRWPRKEAKKDAEKAWHQVNPDGALDDTIDKAMDVWVPIFEERETKYVPLLASWLRGERFYDQAPTKRTTISPPIVKPPTLVLKPQTTMAQQQMDAHARIVSLINTGMSPDEAKQTVYVEMGWIRKTE